MEPDDPESRCKVGDRYYEAGTFSCCCNGPPPAAVGVVPPPA